MKLYGHTLFTNIDVHITEIIKKIICWHIQGRCCIKSKPIRLWKWLSENAQQHRHSSLNNVASKIETFGTFPKLNERKTSKLCTKQRKIAVSLIANFLLLCSETESNYLSNEIFNKVRFLVDRKSNSIVMHKFRSMMNKIIEKEGDKEI